MAYYTYSIMKSYPVCCKTVTPFALARRPFTIRVENVSETAQKEFIELITSHAAQNDFSSVSVTKFWINCVISCSALDRVAPPSLSIFQQPRYLCETDFRACWLSNLNTEIVDSL